MFRSSFQGLKSGNLGHRLLATLVWSAKLVEPYKNNIAHRTEIETKVHIVEENCSTQTSCRHHSSSIPDA